jgi:heme/copper-type cytochrome/quinol oxidase subunit 2
MELHPFLFALLAYWIAAVIAVCVTFIVKIISYTVQRKKNAAQEPPQTGDKGGSSA